MALLKAYNLALGYDGKKVLSNLNFTVETGDFVSVIGENGSGKTTLIKGILGLIGKTEGSIEFSDGLAQNNIGYLGQKTNISRDFPASVEEIVMSGFLNSKLSGLFYSKAQRQDALRLMERTGIIHLRKASFSQLSGGQQQRVLLCRALCATSKLILLDEPITGLDPIASSEFYTLLKELNNEGVTVIMVTHDVTSAIRLSSHILYLGKNTSFFGNTHEYLHSNVGRGILIEGCPCDSCSHNKKGGRENA
ncbi:MAG: ABC transporter ATP-binding protein [Ruminococcaceae bacterium]|nr:ABC transporter ATP-binding protein [Oscillospiraceae bacterium]